MSFSEKKIKIISGSPLFKGIARHEIKKYLESVNVFLRHYEAGEQLIYQGELGTEIHLVLSGTAVGERIEADGRTVTINEFTAGELFGDMLSGMEEKSPVSVRMTEGGDVLRLPFFMLIGNPGIDMSVREKMLRNLIAEIGEKYFALQRRLDILLCLSLRGKISSYLLAESERQGSLEFIVPHNREDQAQILNCDRSALSRELSRMKEEGLIDYSGKRFVLSDPAALAAL